MSPIWFSKDAVAGFLFASLGLFVVVVSAGYRVGSAMHMGPGYFPLVLGGLLILIGLLVMGRAVVSRASPIEGFGIWPVVRIIGAVIAFGLAIRPLGLVPAVVTLVVISRLDGPGFDFRGVAILSLVLAGMMGGIFVVGLGVPIKLWPF
jgi:hypothetical protein